MNAKKSFIGHQYFPYISLLFLIPCSDALDHLLLHPISTATGSVTARLPSNNNVIKTKLRQ